MSFLLIILVLVGWLVIVGIIFIIKYFKNKMKNNKKLNEKINEEQSLNLEN